MFVNLSKRTIFVFGIVFTLLGKVFNTKLYLHIGFKFLIIILPVLGLYSNTVSQNITIDGYMDKLSYLPGDTAKVYININISYYINSKIYLYDINYKKVDELSVSLFPQTINDTLPYYNGFGYNESFTYVIPLNLRSGFYLWDKKVPFIVKSNEKKHDIVILYESNTIFAYHNLGGKSLYDYNSPGGRSNAVSFLRPSPNFPYGHSEYFMNWVSAFRKCNIGFICDLDMDDYSEIEQARLLIVVGKSEYWTKKARKNFDRFVAEGKNALLLSGDNMFWQVRYSDDKTKLICYKNDMDTISDPLLKTISFVWNVLKYPTMKSIGADWYHGGLGSKNPGYGYKGFGGFKVFNPASPVFKGLNVKKGDTIFLNNNGYDGTLTKGFDQDGFPIIDTVKLGFYSIELIGFDFADTIYNGLGTWIEFRKTDSSGIIINASAVDWGIDGIISPYSDTTRKIIKNMINYLIDDSLFMVKQNPVSITTHNSVICMGGSVKVGVNDYSTTGVYSDTLFSTSGCDSVVVLNLSVLPSCNITQNLTICQNHNISVGNNVYSSTGIYYDTLTTKTGCDSTVTTNLTVLPVKSFSQNISICNGDSVFIGFNQYTLPGVYLDLFVAENGCDSLVTTNLSVKDNSLNNISLSACDSFSLNGTTYANSGIFTQTLTNAVGCDSVITLNLTLNQSTGITLNETACNSYTLNGVTYGSTGNYTQTLTNAAGCDSVITLNLTLNKSTGVTLNETACNGYTLNGVTYASSGIYIQTFTNASGCDSVITLNLNLNQKSFSTINETVCDSYTLNGINYMNSGTYIQTLINSAGCDSSVILELTIFPNRSFSQNPVICGGQSVLVGNNTYTRSGTYYDFLVAANGCDSSVTTNLTVLPGIGVTQFFTTCMGDTVTVGPNTYFLTGTYLDTLTASNGCDSVVTTNLSVNVQSTNQLFITVCDSFSMNGTNYTQSGIYTQTLKNAMGCDSVITLELTLNKSNTVILNKTACNSNTLNGMTYGSSGKYTQTLTNASGCDSVITLNLTLNQSTGVTLNETACNGYTLNGVTYASSGIYIQTLTNAAGCDSIITLNLTLNQKSSFTINETVCDSYTLNGVTYTGSGTYTQILTNAAGCDSVITLKLNFNQSSTQPINESSCDSYVLNGVSYVSSGIYSQTLNNVVGCDSVITLNLTLNQSYRDTLFKTACNSYTLNGVTYGSTGNYTQTLTNAVGCDSVITLNLTLNKNTGVTLNETACNGYTLNGVFYASSGIYTQILTNAAGCDSIITLNLTLNQKSSFTINETVCDSYTLNWVTYTGSGTYTQTLTNATGCDSSVILELTIFPNRSFSQNPVICGGQSILVGNNTYTQSGTYYDFFVATNGCDSSVTTNLTVLPGIGVTQFFTTCMGDTVTVGSNTYFLTGTYLDTLTASNGCDSVVTTNLAVNVQSTNQLFITACDSFLMNGTNYTQSGIYTQTLKNAIGCDSVITLELTLNKSNTIILNETACNSYTLNGMTYGSSGKYTQTLINAWGCDSVIILNLALSQASAVTLSETACNRYTLNGVTYGSSGIYSQTIINSIDCDSILLLSLTILSNSNFYQNLSICSGNSVTVGVNNYMMSGIYLDTLSSINGCDSVVKTKLIVDICPVTENIYSQKEIIKSYPCPSNDIFFIEYTIPTFNKNLNFDIYNVLGEKMDPPVFSNGNLMVIHLKEFREGVYILKVANDKKEIIHKDKIIIIR